LRNKNSSKLKLQKRLQNTKFMLGLGKKLAWTLGLLLLPASAMALDFRSVAVPKAVLYDAPSIAAKKVYLLSQYYPVEVVVNLGDWLKVRDAQGGLNWLEAKQLSNKRWLLVTANKAEIRMSADPGSRLLATVEKDVLLEVLEPKPTNGWLKVKHRDGTLGFVLSSTTWGGD
jgi:SH3-like domain-containing protein